MFTTDRVGTIYVGGSGGHLVTSTDGGQTWTTRLSQPLNPAVGTPGFGIGGQAADPTQPSRAYVALNSYIVTPTPSGSPIAPSPRSVVVRQTDDGGQTWNDLGTGDPGLIHALATGIDGRYLFAATESGVWRLPLR